MQEIPQIHHFIAYLNAGSPFLDALMPTDTFESRTVVFISPPVHAVLWSGCGAQFRNSVIGSVAALMVNLKFRPFAKY